MSDLRYDPHDVEWTAEKSERVWNFYGSRPAFRALYFSAHSGEAIVERAEREVGLRGRRILDFGAGRGDLLAVLLERGHRAGGFEFSEGSAELARGRLAGESGFEGIEVSPELPSPYPDASFDVVFLIEVVEHLLDDQLAATLGEVHRLLTAGGHLVLTTPHAENLELELAHCPDCGATFHRWQHQRSWTVASLRAVAEGAGFETVTATALDWRRRGRLRSWLRRRAGGPHLLYVGARADSSIPFPP